CTAHTVAGNNDGGLACMGETVNHGLVLAMGRDCQQLLKTQRLTALGYLGQRFLCPIGLELPMESCKARSQGGIQYDRHFTPIILLAGDDFLELIQQLLGTPDTERRDEYRATI